MMKFRSPYLGLWLLVAVLAVLPFALPNAFYMDLAIRMAINAVIVLGLNLLIGFAGQISLGHAGFLGIGSPSCMKNTVSMPPSMMNSPCAKLITLLAL